MANNIKLVTYAGSTVTPQDDALVYETAVGQNGIMSGCAMAIKNNNTLHISAGHGIVCGRKFSVVESDITVLLTTGDTLAGRVYVHLDLSNTTDPIQIMTETGSSLTEPIQQTDVNISNGIYEFNLATFTIDALTIADLVDVKPIVEKITDKLDNAKVDTLTTLEQVEATTDDTIPVGAGAVKQLNESLQNENNESFNFGVKDGVRGFFTNPSRADDSFIPFKGTAQLTALECGNMSGTKSFSVSVGNKILVCCNARGDVSSTTGLSNGTLLYSAYKDGGYQYKCYEYEVTSETISLTFTTSANYFVIQIS